MENGEIELGGWKRRNWNIFPGEGSCTSGRQEDMHERVGESSWDIDTRAEARVPNGICQEKWDTSPLLFLSIPAWHNRKKPGVAEALSSRWGSVNLGKGFNS